MLFTTIVSIKKGQSKRTTRISSSASQISHDIYNILGNFTLLKLIQSFPKLFLVENSMTTAFSDEANKSLIVQKCRFQ